MPVITPAQREVIEKHVMAGADARHLLDLASTECSVCGGESTVFVQRKNQIIKEAIDWFRSPSSGSDSHVAVRYIAALAEIVALEDALKYRVKKADNARATLHAATETAG